MSRLANSGIAVEVPTGWEGSIDGGELRQLSSGSMEATRMHVGSFALPVERGSFGSGATEVMAADDILVVLFEYGKESAGTPLFASEGLPRRLSPDDFDRNALQHAIPGQTGLQHFFTEKDRAFCLYVVLGSHIDRAELVPRVNDLLATLEIS